jgi:hypothetical protein
MLVANEAGLEERVAALEHALSPAGAAERLREMPSHEYGFGPRMEAAAAALVEGDYTVPFVHARQVVEALAAVCEQLETSRRETESLRAEVVRLRELRGEPQAVRRPATAPATALAVATARTVLGLVGDWVDDAEIRAAVEAELEAGLARLEGA